MTTRACAAEAAPRPLRLKQLQRQSVCRAAALAAGLGACLSARAIAQVPTTPPAATALRPVGFPPFVNGQLPNGLRTLVVERHAQPVITISLSIPAGSFYDGDGKAGLADLVATLLTKGTASRTADQLSADIEGIGGGIDASAGADYLSISLNGFSSNAEQLFDILGDVVQHATFPATEVDLARTQALSSLQLSLSQPASIASRNFGREIYGNHPYGRNETAASLRSLTREDVVGFYARRVRPGGALLIVAGDLTPAQVRALATRSLGGWRGAQAPAPAAPALPTRTSSEIVLVHKPGAVQSNIVAGFPFIRANDPAYWPLTLGTYILGGGSDSRLFMILREAKGWTYGAYAGFNRNKGIGSFSATAEVRTPVTDSALGELLRQLALIRTETPPDSEITNAKNYLNGRFPLQIETAEQIAGRVAAARQLGLPDDYVLHYREHIAAITPAQLHAALNSHVTTDKMVVVVVGDGTKILNGLKAQGLPVRIVSTDGEPMTEADLNPTTSSVAFVAGRVSAGTFQYRVMVQGNPFGTESRTISRVQDGGRDAWQIVTSSNIGPMLNQTDTSLIDAGTLTPIRVRQAGSQMGQSTFVRLDYSAGRVRGQAHTMGRGGPQDVNSDTTVAAGTLDDNELGAVIQALPLAAGGHWTLPVFSGGKGQAAATTFTVTGEESVTVPAGTFACWKVEITGGEAPLVFYITKDNPVIVKIEIQGAPVAFELVSRG